MSKWYIEHEGNTHDFHVWKDALAVWNAVKADGNGKSVLCKRSRDGGAITLDCA